MTLILVSRYLAFLLAQLLISRFCWFCFFKSRVLSYIRITIPLHRLSFALAAGKIKEKARVVAMDLRGHGKSSTENELDLSIEVFIVLGSSGTKWKKPTYTTHAYPLLFCDLLEFFYTYFCCFI